MSQQYEYRTEMATDILDYINSNITLEDWEFRGDLEDYLYNELWADNSITGNGGNYYNTEIYCETYLAYNLDLMMKKMNKVKSIRFDFSFNLWYNKV